MKDITLFLILKLILSFLFIFLVVFRWENIRKHFFPSAYYIWENKQKIKLEEKVKGKTYLIVVITAFFSLTFIFLFNLGIKPWYSVWVFVFGFLYILFKKANIQNILILLERIYFNVLATSIIPTLIIARFVLIEAILNLWEMLLALDLVLPAQKGVVLATGFLTAVLPLEGTKIFGTPAVKGLVFRPENQGLLTVPKISPKSLLINKDVDLSLLSARLNTFAMLEKGMHLGKLSNLSELKGKDFFNNYNYLSKISPYIEKPERISVGRDTIILEYLNSPQVTKYCEYLQELRKNQDADAFAQQLKFLLEQIQIPNLTAEEVKFIYTTILSKAATKELPPVLLEKEEVSVLFPKTQSQGKEGLIVDDIHYRLKKRLIKLNSEFFKIKCAEISDTVNGDMFMKDVKEQLGIAVKERSLVSSGVNIVNVSRDPSFDYLVKMSDESEVFLECKSRAPEFFNLEVKKLQLKLEKDQKVELFFENTRTWEKTLYKVTKDGYKEIYKEGPKK